MKRILTKQQRYEERQKAMGRRRSLMFLTPEEVEVAKKAVKEYRELHQKAEA